MRCCSSGSQCLSGSHAGDWLRLGPIVVQFCLWQWNDGGSLDGGRFVWGPLSFNSAFGNGTTVGPGWGSPFFGVPSAVTSLVCGPLLFNSASGNGTTVGHGWGSPCCGSTQWLFCTKALHRPVFALFAGWEAALPFQVPEASATPVVINARLFLLVLQLLFVRHVKALCRSQPGGLSMLGTQRVADGRSLQKNASM